MRQFLEYLLASAVALCVDFGCYLGCVRYTSLDLPTAAVLGYFAGLLIAYAWMTSRIFRNGWLRPRRSLELLLFGVSGLLGILLTFISVRLYVLTFGEKVFSAKLFAVAISFFGVYFFRRFVVFRSS